MKNLILLVVVPMILFFGITEVKATCHQPNSVTKVFKFKNATHEYVIFKIKKPFTGGLIVTPLNAIPYWPIDEGGEEINTVHGCRFVQVRFTGMEWMCRTKPINFPPSTSRIKDVRLVGNFESVVTYMVGYKCPANKYQGYSRYSIGGYDYVELKFKK